MFSWWNYRLARQHIARGHPIHRNWRRSNLPRGFVCPRMNNSRPYPQSRCFVSAIPTWIVTIERPWKQSSWKNYYSVLWCDAKNLWALSQEMKEYCSFSSSNLYNEYWWAESTEVHLIVKSRRWILHCFWTKYVWIWQEWSDFDICYPLQTGRTKHKTLVDSYTEQLVCSRQIFDYYYMSTHKFTTDLELQSGALYTDKTATFQTRMYVRVSKNVGLPSSCTPYIF
jgi:hypothetical protein